MTLTEQLQAMPEKDRYKFFKAMIGVSEAGRKAGASPQEWARMYADTYNKIDRQLKEQA